MTMTSPPSFSFSKPAMPGDAVSVTVLVEDSPAMTLKWPDIRDAYLPNLLEHLRGADPAAQMEARWLTSSSASSAPSFPIADTAEARSVPDLPLSTSGTVKLSPAVISSAITTLSSATRQQNTTRHLILVAATGPLTTGLNDTTPSGFDTWDDIAMVLKQQYIRLHVILSIGAEMRTYHELFKRSLQLQNNSEVPAWFPVDSRRYSIRLSGRPQYVRGSGAVPIALVSTTAVPEDAYSNPSPGSSSGAASPPATASSPGSPVQPTSPGSRKLPHSPTTPRTRSRAPDSPQSPPAAEGGGLVSYLQQMHGLTKKKSYGIKAPKKTYADMRLPGSGGRPILPRLEVPQPPSDIYAYPAFDHASPEMHASSADQQQALPIPQKRHSADHLPASSLVARTSNEDRRARRRGPWLPIAPHGSSVPSSPATATSAGTLAALQSLASMTPRLPDFATTPSTKERMTAASGAPGTPVDSATTYYASSPVAWSQIAPASHSPTHSSIYRTSAPPTPSLVGSDYAPSSAASTPASLCAPATDASSDDQLFIVTPEYEASVNARFDEAVRSGAMQASMTVASAMHSATTAALASQPTYAQNIQAQQQQQQTFYPTLGQAQAGREAYPTMYAVGQGGDYMSAVSPQGNGAWAPYEYDSYEYAGAGMANGYMAPPLAGYSGTAQGQWYPA